MSTSSSNGLSAAGTPSLTSPSSSSHLSSALSDLAHGYAIAIAVVVLLLLSALLLASYLCYRSRLSAASPTPTPTPSSGLSLPRIVFVAEDDEESGAGAQSPAPGLDPAAINSYPKFPFVSGKGGDSACAICLCEYREGEMLRMMPDCRHYFHLMCVDAWLRLNASCPVCRTSPMPTPLSTPLSELVPLSQFPAGRRRS